jgi:tripartite-type tricarboxylate transporter receptor subunit TctC
MTAGVNLQVVPYRGSPPALTDLLAGQVQVMFDLTSSSLEYIRAGKLRALAVNDGGAHGSAARYSYSRRDRAWV